MVVRFDMDEAFRAVKEYNEAIELLKEYTDTIRDDYLSIRNISWRGKSEKAFFSKFNIEIYAVWEQLICQLENTRDAIRTSTTAAEPIKYQGDNLM